jgi:hypothetical protein
MQTFVPYASFHLSAMSLDRQRLGKQRVETLQLLNAITGRSKGWTTHPAAVMWRDNPAGLAAYGVAVCQVWRSRGYNDTCESKIIDIVQPDASDLPEWWGDHRVHSSHRANLLRKFPEHYSKFCWKEDPTMPYFWPTQEVTA